MTSGDRGSVTVWTLGMVLVVLFLGALSFDLWSGFGTRRDYAGAADQAAQAGANALDTSLFRSTGERKLDPERAEQLAAENLATHGLANVTGVVIEATTDEVVVVLEGEMEFEVEGEVQHPEPGEELFIPAGAVHSARNIGNSTARWLFGYRGNS